MTSTAALSWYRVVGDSLETGLPCPAALAVPFQRPWVRSMLPLDIYKYTTVYIRCRRNAKHIAWHCTVDVTPGPYSSQRIGVEYYALHLPLRLTPLPRYVEVDVSSVARLTWLAVGRGKRRAGAVVRWYDSYTVLLERLPMVKICCEFSKGVLRDIHYVRYLQHESRRPSSSQGGRGQGRGGGG